MKSMSRLIWISLSGMLFFANPAKSQFEPINGYHAGALLFSQTSWNGSARITGLGGAQASLGGDISSASGNPAGLGFYNRSEFSISPSLNFISANTEYLNSPNSSTKVNFNIGNLGVVINKSRTPSEGDLFYGGSFGFSYNRVNDFHHEVFYSGDNSTNDFIDFVLTDVVENGFDNGHYVHGLSFDTYLINDFDFDVNGDTIDGWSSFVEPPDAQTAPRQSERIKSKGSQDQWSFSYGGNFKDRLYFGLSLGIVSLNYQTGREYREQRYPSSILDYFELNETLSISGMGVNGTFGAIIRPVDFISIGLAYTTPTIYEVNDEFNSNMQSIWKNDAYDYYPNDDNFSTDIYSESDPIVSQYAMKTAGRLNTGATFFINKNGFITGDVEWIDYSRGKLTSGDIDFQGDNETIRETYKPAINFRVGGEYRVDMFRFRAGLNQRGNAFNQSDDFNHTKNTFAGGVGYRGKSFYTDLAIQYSTYQSEASPYSLNPEPIASINNNKMAFIMSFGFLF